MDAQDDQEERPTEQPAPMQGWVFLGPGAEDRADERPDVDGGIEQLRALSHRLESLSLEIDMEGYVVTRADIEALHGLTLGAWGCLEQIWDGEGLVRG